MAMTYKNWNDRDAGHGTDPKAEHDLHQAYLDTEARWWDKGEYGIKLDYYFLATEHRTAMYIHAGDKATEISDAMVGFMHGLGYDRVDIEQFGGSHVILTIPDTWKN